MRTASIGGVVATVVALLAGSVPAGREAQQPAGSAAAAFEVASIKRSDPDAIGGVISGPTPGQFTIKNQSLDCIIMYAFGLREYQLSGGPGWIRSDRFDIVAKYPPGSPEQGPPVTLMLQTLLADRFKLTTHAETREGPTYALVMARGDRQLGPKLRVSTLDCDALMAARRAGPSAAPPPGVPVPCIMLSRGNTLSADTMTMAQLASGLAARVARPVVDRTGLTGSFTFTLEWSAALVAAVPNADAPTPPDDQTSIFTALQEQLGLKLQSERGPIDMRVIDSVEPPRPD